MMAPGPAALAAANDSLNVGFNGSLVGTTAYTTAGDEKMRGVLHRVDGAEEQVPLSGVKLSGGRQGIRFDAADLNLGTQVADQGFLGEVSFTPTGAGDMSTIFSAAGNLFIRAQGGNLRYGYASPAGEHVKTVDFPSLNQEHVVSFHYLPSDSGTVLTVMLDGVVLPAVASAQGPSFMKIWAGPSALATRCTRQGPPGV